MKLEGNMVRLSTWKQLVEESAASERMKLALMTAVDIFFPAPKDDLVDCFHLGLLIGRLSQQFTTNEELLDFGEAIRDTRDLDQLPIVKSQGKWIS